MLRIKNIIKDLIPYGILRRYRENKSTLPDIVKLAENKCKKGAKLHHISAFPNGNLGDTILTIALRGLFEKLIPVKEWSAGHVSQQIGYPEIEKINSCNALVVGGGGLFLADSCPNLVSGWQWNCSIEAMNRITVPLILFGVGYNQFRGQRDFPDFFKKNLNEVIRKAYFVGIRNHGSIEHLKKYLSEDLHDKLIFQPCMTTLLSQIYPNADLFKQKRKNFIILNCAFDRLAYRGVDDRFCKQLAYAMKKIGQYIQLKYVVHVDSDKYILPFLKKEKVDIQICRCNNIQSLLSEYSQCKLAISMRGHGQLIPFGCNTPILSLITHDKLKFFLDDIEHPEWGIEIKHETFPDELVQKTCSMLQDFIQLQQQITASQEKLFKITKNNMIFIRRGIVHE